jgi:hypothetical protein
VISTHDLISHRRWDVAIKHRFFAHLRYGGDPDSDRVYRWHIEQRKAANAKINLGMDGKSGTDQYVQDCRNLIKLMWEYGFLPQYAIPIDVDGELLGGAHRLACALALGIDAVPVERHHRRAIAPAWGEQWFIDNGLLESDLERLREDFSQWVACQNFQRAVSHQC